jgi:di/tricarboxylate transporter
VTESDLTLQQGIVFVVLLATLVLFIVGRWRYDLVALLALLTLTIIGEFPGVGSIINPQDAFSGFGHPAVVTVAAVLVVGRGLLNSGLVQFISERMTHIGDRPVLQVMVMTTLITACSGFMNNVGALAILMPVAIQMARKGDCSPSFILMPIAFGSLLGGMMTLIGTPPNIIIASYREEIGREPFRMFDFMPVGIAVATVGTLFIGLVGWRLIPQRKGQRSREEMFEISDYLTEVLVPENSNAVGETLGALEIFPKNNILVVGIVRGDRRLNKLSPYDVLHKDDILIIQTDSASLKALVDTHDFALAEDKGLEEEFIESDEAMLLEAVVMPGSIIIGRHARGYNLQERFDIFLLAIARQGSRLHGRLSTIRIKVGDVLLLRGREEVLFESGPKLGYLPLATRGLKLEQTPSLVFALLLFGLALVCAALGVIPVQIAFSFVALAMILTGFMSVREAYESIEWPIIILLGAMIPVGSALESTGGATRIAEAIVGLGSAYSTIFVLVIVLVATMFLSDLVNNAAAALLMAPIAVRVAEGIDASPDPFLMSVAVGASCAFLTPIGHQSNALVMGPGGYKFSDYWRMGLPLEIIVTVVSVPVIVWWWPLHPV